MFGRWLQSCNLVVGTMHNQHWRLNLVDLLKNIHRFPPIRISETHLLLCHSTSPVVMIPFAFAWSPPSEWAVPLVCCQSTQRPQSPIRRLHLADVGSEDLVEDIVVRIREQHACSTRKRADDHCTTHLSHRRSLGSSVSVVGLAVGGYGGADATGQ